MQELIARQVNITRCFLVAASRGQCGKSDLPSMEATRSHRLH